MRQCFYSFHYKPDVHRVSQVRNMGVIEGNRPATDNDWETVVGGGEPAIKRWIANQMRGRSCTIVLVGNNTAGRKWITYEIVESWNARMGVVGIRIHGLKNLDGYIANVGGNPFDHVTYGQAQNKLSSVVKCHNPPGADSKERYGWIARNLEIVVEQAIEIRKVN